MALRLSEILEHDAPHPGITNHKRLLAFYDELKAALRGGPLDAGGGRAADQPERALGAPTLEPHPPRMSPASSARRLRSARCAGVRLGRFLGLDLLLQRGASAFTSASSAKSTHLLRRLGGKVPTVVNRALTTSTVTPS